MSKNKIKVLDRHFRNKLDRKQHNKKQRQQHKKEIENEPSILPVRLAKTQS